jgi:hypothetical protein
MLSRQAILEQLGMIANSWWSIAAAWHVVFGSLFIAIAGGWRPRHRVLGAVLATAVASVSAIAWEAGSPFNSAVFALLAVVLAALLRTLPARPIQLSSWPTVAFAASLALFALVYPHFSPTASWPELLLVAPLGLIPCPTLSMVIAVTLLAGGFDSRRWSAIVAAAGLFYGLIGVLALGVGIDLVLFAGALILGLTIQVPSPGSGVPRSVSPAAPVVAPSSGDLASRGRVGRVRRRRRPTTQSSLL